ncbi:MAG: hypothetical protein QF632_02710 [Candidatus Woesearchaeota archaeon]|nr:hypothetical protein [Candidatus Woesearchaeota archaeon]MDP7323647.1 hypothetical protein [Candidatus Woesearchaeota archaeon]
MPSIQPLLDVFLLGLGPVGQAFLRRSFEPVYQWFNVVGVQDSTACLLTPSGLTTPLLEEISEKKQKKKGLDAIEIPDEDFSFKEPSSLRYVPDFSRNRPFVVLDASDQDTSVILANTLQRVGYVAGVNKVPFSQDSCETELLYSAAMQEQKLVYMTGTVGADIGVPDALINILREEGPEYVKISAVATGTGTYVCSRLEQNEDIEAILATGFSEGITERKIGLDMSGIDVERKAIILAKIIQQYDPVCEVKITRTSLLEGIAPSGFEESSMGLEGGDYIEAIDRDHTIRTEFKRKFGGVREGMALRYVLDLEYQQGEGITIDIGLKEVPKDSTIGSLTGTDNVFHFYVNCPPGQDVVKLPIEAYSTLGPAPGAGPDETANALYKNLESVKQQILKDS